MHASIHDPKSRQVSQTLRSERPLAQSVFSGEARLRELEHLADTARKVRDQAAAELTRSSGATHHVARERIAAAESMLRKTQREIAELRLQLAQPLTGTSAPQPGMTTQDFELAVMLGHNKGRFSQVGGAHAPLELQQDTAVVRQTAVTATPGIRQSKSGTTGKRISASGLLLAVGLGLGALGLFAMFNHGMVSDASQAVRDSTTQLIIRIRALLPNTDAGDHSAAKTSFSKADHSLRRQPI